MRRPNLFIIGAPKCGTTSLHDFLALHPDAFMSDPKEPGFFVPEMTYYPKDEAWYLGLFRDAGDARVVGESSTHYAKIPRYQGVPARIAAYAPDARLIYLMRDPVKRAISHYWHNLSHFEEHRPIVRALRENTDYVSFGDYQAQLEPYFERFPREQILTLVFEEIVANPEAVLPSVLSFLGLDVSVPLDLPRSNVRPDEIRRVKGRGILRKFATSRTWERVYQSVPQAIKDAGKSMALGPAKPDPDGERSGEQYLRRIYQEKVAGLSDLLGRPFPAWKSVLGDSVPLSRA